MPKKSSAKPEVSVSTTRAKVSHASDPALGALARLPQGVVLAAFAMVMVVGIAVRGVVGAICFGLIALALAWLLYLSWNQLRPLDRLARGTVLVFTAAVALVLAFPK